MSASPYTSRDWQFWALWLTIRLPLAYAFYAFGWMPAFWFMLGELYPDAAWCWQRDKAKELDQHADALTHTIASLNTENASLLATVEAYQRRAGRASISSITFNQAWPSARRPH